MTLRRIRHHDSYIAIKELSEEHSEYPVSTMCEILKINRAAYYKWKNHTNSENDDLNELIAEKVLEIHGEHPDMGYRRIRDTLAHDYNINVNDKRVLRVCRKKKVQSYIKHRYNCCTKPASDPAYIAENVLNREFKSDKPNEKWLTDITEFNIPAGKVYLSPIIDCFDGMPITWTIGISPCADLVNTMIDDGIAQLKPGEYPIVHTDRGCHYRWPGWIQRMDKAFQM